MHRKEDTRMSTNHNETQLLHKYAPFINRTAGTFMGKLDPHNRNGVIDLEDLRQEVTIAFLQIIRTEGEEAIFQNRLTYLHVMWDTVRKAYPFAIPYYAFGTQSKEPIYLFSVEEDGETDAFARGGEEDIITQIMIDQLPEPKKTIIRMKLDGMSQREISHALGVSDATVSRMIQRLRRSIKSNDKYFCINPP